LLRETGLADSEATVYFQVTRGAAPRTHQFPSPTTPPTIYVEAKPFQPPLQLRQQGASALIVADQRWARCDIKTIGLLANTLAKQQACEAGALEAILCKDGLLQEGSHSSMLFVKDGVLLCPPLTSRLLPGVTRKAVLSAAASASIPTVVRPCPESELAAFDEVLMLSTTAEIVPITVVNGVKVGQGMPGPITRKLQAVFQDLLLQERNQLSA
jgi:D-alanine transaminase